MLGDMKGKLAYRLKLTMLPVLLLSWAVWRSCAQTALSAKPKPSSHLIERATFDWNHSGKSARFSLFRKENADGQTSDDLVIDSGEANRWSLRSRDGEWASIADGSFAHLKNQNLVPTARHFFFVSSGSAQAHTYLILKGVDSGCCVGSLTVLTANDRSQPTIVFHSSSHLLQAIEPTGDHDELALIGQPSDSEARALKNAQSYDPYRVYLLNGDHAARYDLARSKAYTVAHYCQWHGPVYNEKFVAVGAPTGASHCWVMSDADFTIYREKYPSLFLEP